MNILIPMAGEGSRFQTAGYTFPKPLIEIFSKPMIEIVVDTLACFKPANFIYLVRKEHFEKYNLDYVLNNITPGCTLVIVDKLTEGAACTTLLAKDYINNDNPLLIANSDQYVEFKEINQFYNDGTIFTFTSTHPKWSYAKINEDGFVTEVAEKKPISKHATCGIYLWKHGSDYVKYAEQMIAKNIRVNNEFYVCPVFNEAINDGKKIEYREVREMYGLGTPEDLQNFERNCYDKFV